MSFTSCHSERNTNRNFFRKFCNYQYNGKIDKGKLISDKIYEQGFAYQHELYGHYGCVNSVSFSHGEAKFLASGSDDQRVLIWNFFSGFKQKPMKEFLGHRSNIFCAIFDHTNRHILSCGNDETILRFDIEYAKQGKENYCDKFLFHEAAVYKVSFACDNDNIFLSAGDDGYLALWDLRAYDKGPQRVLYSSGSFNCVDFNPKIPHLFVSGHSKESAQLWDLRNAHSERSGRRRRTKPFNFNTLDDKNVSGAYWNKTGDRIVCSVRKSYPMVFVPYQKEPLCVCYADNYKNSCTLKMCAFVAPEHDWVVSGSDDFRIYCWRLPKSFDKEKQTPYHQRWQPYTNELFDEQNQNNNNNNNNNHHSTVQQQQEQQRNQNSLNLSGAQSFENLRDNVGVFTVRDDHLTLVNSLPNQSAESSPRTTKRKMEEVRTANAENVDSDRKEMQLESEETETKEEQKPNDAKSKGNVSPISKKRKVGDNQHANNDTNGDETSKVPERYKRIDKYGVYVLPAAHCVLAGHRSIPNNIAYHPHYPAMCTSGVEKIIKVWSPYPMTEDDKEPHKRARRKPFGHQEARELVSEMYLFGHEEERDVTESTKTLALFDFFTLTDELNASEDEENLGEVVFYLQSDDSDDDNDNDESYVEETTSLQQRNALSGLFAQDPFEDRTEYVNEVQETSTSSDVNDDKEEEKSNNTKDDKSSSPKE
jgi:WD40 repeat protein